MLMDKGEPSAVHDSSARAYPPKCHPDTRRALRHKIIQWGQDRGTRASRMVWVMGPAAVGKSAVAQTIAEDFAEVGHLGASFFFSRPNHRDNPETLIPTLIYQLAIKLPEYKQIITKRLGDDPTILHKNRRAQFRELVTEPFLFLKAKRHPVTASPPLIVIDGLDECSDQEAQCEFVELVSSVNHLPLLWLVCSRPEFHLKSIQSNPDFHLACLREDLLIDDKEAQQDAQRLLQSEFKKIRRCYSNQLDVDWPPQEHVRCIAATASGHLGFTAFVLRFIGDKERGDPDSQLQICVRFIGGGRSRPGALNPLHALDLLYREIFSSIPTDYLGTAMRVLSLTILYPHDKLSAQDHANFLSLDRAAFYRSLQKLHSVLSIPSASEAHTAGLYVYHASFSDFLKDSNRSGRYAIDEGTAHLDIAIRSLQWQVTAREAALRACSRVNHVSLPLEWTGSRDADELKENLRSFSSRVGLIACCKVQEDQIPSILTALHEFPFSVLHKQEMEDSETILPFINWLRSHELEAEVKICNVNPRLARRSLTQSTIGRGGSKELFSMTRSIDLYFDREAFQQQTEGKGMSEWQYILGIAAATQLKVTLHKR